VLDEGDSERAVSIFSQLQEMAPEHPAVISGLARALIATGRLDEAKGLIAGLPEKLAADPAISRARSALALAETAPSGGDTAEQERRIAADPDDHQARFDLAGALMGRGDREGAADQLFEIIRRDRDWNDGAARKRLLQFLEVIGLEDPWVSQQRRRLSAILFT
jgi:putative thioredoxin